MATTTQQSDFNRVKRWGKEFLAAPAGGTGRTGQGPSRSDATAKPQGDADKMTARTTQFNPPPGWPPAPAGLVAPPGLAAGSFVARTARGMATVDRRQPGHITEG